MLQGCDPVDAGLMKKLDLSQPLLHVREYLIFVSVITHFGFVVTSIFDRRSRGCDTGR